MAQRVDVTVYGFRYGKYTYFWRKKKLYRQSPSFNVILIKLQLYGGSLRYAIQGDLHESVILSLLSYMVNVSDEVPF